MEILRALTLCVHAFKFYENKEFSSYSPSKLWEHSIETAHAAKRLAHFEKLPRSLCEEAFVSGLLHDIGKLIMAANASKDYEAVMERSAGGTLPTDEIEREIFGVTHAQIGAYLLGLWGLPDAIVNTVDLHHDPRNSAETSFTPLAAVHAAQCLRPGVNRLNRLDTEYIKGLGLESRIPLWQEALLN
jgi:putative nucleotidyltransferase with HDIG domain